MMEDPFDQMDKLLCTWNLPQLCGIFREQEITFETLDALNESDIEALIPKVGPRALFRKRLKEWLQNPQICSVVPSEHQTEAVPLEQSEIFSFIDEEDNEVEVLDEVWLTDEMDGEIFSTEEQKSEDHNNTDIDDDVDNDSNSVEMNVVEEQLSKKEKSEQINLKNTEKNRQLKSTRIEEYKNLVRNKKVEKKFNNKTKNDEAQTIIKKEEASVSTFKKGTKELPKEAAIQRHCQRIGRNWAGLNVEEILLSSESGRSILENYESNPMLDKRTRYYLADLIVTEAFAKNLIMDRYKFDNIANQIVSLFPTEDKSSWFLPNKSSQKSSGGTLYYKYYSTYTKMRKSGFYQHYVDGVTKHLDSDASLSAEIEHGDYSVKLKDIGEESDKSAFKRAIPRYERQRNSSDFERIDVKELLESSYEGLGLIDFYEKNQSFDVQTRNRICKLICMEGINRNIKMQPKDFYDISCQINNLFPNEKHATYFLPRGKTPPKGCLYHKYIYLIRRLKKMGLGKNNLHDSDE